MRVVLDTPLTVYRTLVTRDSLGGEARSLVSVIDPAFAMRVDLSGRELFEAQQLKYEQARKYVMLDNSSIIEGMFVTDGSETFIIYAITRKFPERVWMELSVYRRRDMETSS